MATSPLQRLIDAGLQFTEVTRQQAEGLVQQFVDAGDIQLRDADRAIRDLVDRGKETSDRLSKLVQREVTKQVGWLSERFDTIDERVEELAENLAERVGDVVPGVPVAQQSNAKKSGTNQSTAKKATSSKKSATTKAAKNATSKKGATKSGTKKTAKKKTAKKKKSGTKKSATKKSATKKTGTKKAAVGSSGVGTIATSRSNR